MLEGLPQRPGKPGSQKPNNGLEHPVRRHGIPSMNAKRTVTPGKHDGTVGVQLHRSNAAKAQRIEPAAQAGFRRIGQPGCSGVRSYHLTRTR